MAGKDRVISYAVKESESSVEDPAVIEAVNEGYRVIDVIHTAMSKGGAGGGAGPVLVTVILADDTGKIAPYLSLNKRT